MSGMELDSEKKLAYVEVYEALYKLLKDGTFPTGSKLPSEPKLAKMLNVSRETLRQALDLLNDDGMLKKVKGSGNYITDNKRPFVVGLEQIGHPLFKGSMEAFDDVQMEYSIQASNDYQKELLNMDTPVVIAADIWYRKKGVLIGYTFGFIAVETASKYQLDLNDKEKVIEFFKSGVYELAVRSQLQIYPTSAGNTIVAEFAEKAENVAMIQEKIFADELYPIIVNKHYILASEARFELNVMKK